MGESKLKQKLRDETLMTCTGVQTVAGRVQVRWESKSEVPPVFRLPRGGVHATSFSFC